MSGDCAASRLGRGLPSTRLMTCSPETPPWAPILTLSPLGTGSVPTGEVALPVSMHGLVRVSMTHFWATGSQRPAVDIR